MLKINYDQTSGNIIGFYPNVIDYKIIPEPFIEVDLEQYNDCVNNQCLRKVDTLTKKVIECTLPSLSKEEKIQRLDSEYQPKFVEITRSWSNANMDQNLKLMEQKQIEKQNLIKEYNNKREVIING